MKREEMLLKISQFIGNNTSTPSDRCNKTAKMLLDLIEDEGMLPPVKRDYDPDWHSTSISDSDIKEESVGPETFRKVYYVEVNEWDLE